MVKSSNVLGNNNIDNSNIELNLSVDQSNKIIDYETVV